MSTTAPSRLRLGAPQVSGSLSVFPILGGVPQLVYQSLSQAVAKGAFVKELDARGSVNDVLVCNVTDQPILLFEGELIEGARQHRTIDAPVLVPAGVELSIPVSCVEQGRWDGRKSDAHFEPAARTVDPALRARKRATANRGGAAGADRRRAQQQVWREVAVRLESHAVASPSASLSDVYEAKRPGLEEVARAIHVVDGQLGVIAQVSGRCVALDLVSRPDVFADLLPRLTQGYGLQALTAEPGDPSIEAAVGFLCSALEAPRRWVPTPGMGDAFAPTVSGVEGCGLIVERELVALSAFPCR
jgi:ARG and Rhodanese-Phosphatase-superfamily-associated Protein domain